jgi:hypothetical protein
MEMTRLSQQIDGGSSLSPKFDMNPEPVTFDFTKDIIMVEEIKPLHPTNFKMGDSVLYNHQIKPKFEQDKNQLRRLNMLREVDE